MAWITVDKDGSEYITYLKPIRGIDMWIECGESIEIPKGTSFKLTGKQMTWNDEPFELE